MPIRRTTIALLASAATLLLPGVALASSHPGALRACTTGKLKLRLDVSAAEKAAGGEPASTAAALAGTELAELQAAADGVCPAARRLRAALRPSTCFRSTVTARARVPEARSGTCSRRTARTRTRARAAHSRAIASTGCEFDGTVHVHPREAPGVAADLAAAAAAQQGGDAMGAREAINAADRAYERWVTGGAGGAQSAGDWLAVAAAAQMLGLEAVAEQRDCTGGPNRQGSARSVREARPLHAHARQRAESAADRRVRDAARRRDGKRRTSARATARSSTGSSRGARRPQRLRAVVAHSAPHPSDGWGFSWGPGSFEVNRKTGVIADASGVGAGWPGEVAAFSGPCTENGVVVGNGSVPATPFHFNIAGSVTSGGFLLTLRSAEANVSISVIGPPACHFLGELGQQFINAFVSDFEMELPVTTGQTTASLVLPLEDAAITLTATRTS